jgi:uncharacterized protein YkwD
MESRVLLSGFSWSSDEVYLLELVNRARSDPMAEAALLGLDLTLDLSAGELANLGPKEPLALNEALTRAARLHSQDMADRDFFDHVNPDGDDPTDRANAQGYIFSAGENIAKWTPGDLGKLDEIHEGWMESVGHRKNVLSLWETFSDTFHYDEFGPGFSFTSGDPATGYYSEEFGYQGTDPDVYVLGVVYDDANGDDFYTVGEGLANVRIDVSPVSAPDFIAETYTTDAAGNYQIVVEPSDYIITFTNMGTGLVKTATVTVTDENVKIDATLDEMIQSPPISGVLGPSASVAPTADNDGRMSVATINEDGDPVVFQRETRYGQWNLIDLRSRTGSPAITGAMETWVDPQDGLTYAAGLASTGLILYRQAADGSWSYRNLNTELPSAGFIVDQLEVMISPTGQVNLTGLDDGGDLIRFYQNGTLNGQGEYGWNATDLGEHLRDRGQAMPAFEGELVSYSTSWGALNVVGLDAGGAIWTVWWAPGQPGWNANDLSTLYGAEPIVGGLTVFLTSWKGMNIAGIDSAGHLQVTWWVPSFKGKGWAHNDLTADFDGPLLEPSSVSSFVSSWDGMNVAGLDQTTGEVQVYWWSPARKGIGWGLSSLTSAVDPSQLLPVRSLRGLAAPTNIGSLNVFGVDESDHLVRYYWEPGFRGYWLAQDLTALT